MIAGAGDKVGDFSSNFTASGPGRQSSGGVGKVVGKGVAGMAALVAPAPINAQEKNGAMLEGMMFDRGLDGATEMR